MKKILMCFSFIFIFLICASSVNVGATGVLVPDDSSGGATLVPGNSSEELFQACHDYITTNIISEESLVEALNGKIYSNFTQEDCMEMINIASKREVIKNTLYIPDTNNVVVSGINISSLNETINFNGTSTSNATIYRLNLTNPLESGIYTISTIFTGNMSGTYIGLGIDSNNSYITSFDMSKTKKYTFDYTNGISSIYIAVNSGFSFNNVTLKIQIEKGSTATRYVSYDYRREYYQEGINYADSRLNEDSISYDEGFELGREIGYSTANKDGKILGGFIPNLLGGIGSFFLMLLNIDFLGFNLLSVIGILITIVGVIIVIKLING